MTNAPVTWEMLQRTVKSANAQIDHCEKLVRDLDNRRE